MPRFETIVFSAALSYASAPAKALKRGPMLSIGVYPFANPRPLRHICHVCWVLPRKNGPVGVLKRNR